MEKKKKTKPKVKPSRAPVLEVTIEAARVRVAKLEQHSQILRIVQDQKSTQCQLLWHVSKLLRPLHQWMSMPTIHRPHCEAHCRAGPISRSPVGPLAGGSGPIATSATVAARPTTVPPVVASDVSPEVARLKNMVSQLQVQLTKSAGLPVVAMDSVVQESPQKKGRVKPENFVCQTVEEVIEWMDARQPDMHVALEAGNAPEVSRLAAMLAWRRERCS